MPLADSSRAIGEATELLRSQLSQLTGLNVTVGRVEPPTGAGGPVNPRLNLFLYEAEFDGSMRNLALGEGQRPRLWLALRYLVTAFDEQGRSDSVDALRHLGKGLRTLQGISYVPLDGVAGSTLAALVDNPEPLKVSFVGAPSDLLSKLMQGSDERYRFSMAFELRPVMIATAEAGQHALLVGVPYEAPPPGVAVPEDGIGIQVLPSLGMRLTRIEPEAATAGDDVTILGEDLTAADVVARLGPVELPVTGSAEGALAMTLDPAVVDGDSISAGQHPLTLVRTIATRRRSSNPLVFELLPTVTAVTAGALAVSNPGDPDTLLEGTFEVEGTFLGGKGDDLLVALYANGRTVRVLADAADVAGADAQTRKRITIAESQAVPPGDYRVIVRVNNSQARQSPTLTLSAP
jgi:hypothetical protein